MVRARLVQGYEIWGLYSVCRLGQQRPVTGCSAHRYVDRVHPAHSGAEGSGIQCSARCWLRRALGESEQGLVRACQTVAHLQGRSVLGRAYRCLCFSALHSCSSAMFSVLAREDGLSTGPPEPLLGTEPFDSQQSPYRAALLRPGNLWLSDIP